MIFNRYAFLFSIAFAFVAYLFKDDFMFVFVSFTMAYILSHVTLSRDI